MGRISTGLGTSWESALTLGFFVFRCFSGLFRSLSVCGVGVVCVYFRRRGGRRLLWGDGKSYSGYYKAPGRLLWETRDADVASSFFASRARSFRVSPFCALFHARATRAVE